MGKHKKNIFHFQPWRVKAFTFISILSFFLAFILSLVFSPIFEIGEAQITDQLFRLRYSWFGKEKIHPFLVHIVFDDESLHYFNTSPWDRNIYGKVISILKKAGVDRIAYDIFFQHSGFKEKDDVLVYATEEAGNVYYPVIFFPKSPASGLESFPGSNEDSILDNSFWYPVVTGKGSPDKADITLTVFKQLATRAKGMGHINCTPDRDGISRWFPLVIGYKSGYIPALTLGMVCDYLEVEPERIELTFGKHMVLKNAHVIGDMKKDISIPVDKKGRVLLNYPAPWKDSFYEISVKDLFSAQEDELYKLQLKDTLEHSLVLVSDNSVRNKDVGPGVFENLHPYSEILMTLCNMVLTETFLTSLGEFPLFLIIISFSVLLCFFSSSFRLAGFFISSLFISFLYIALSLFLFLFLRIVPVILFPGIGFCFYILGGSVYLYHDKKKEAEMLKGKVEKEREERIKLEKEKRSILASIKKLLPGPKVLINKKGKNKYERTMLKNSAAFEHIITKDNKMLQLFFDIENLAASPKPILILGETGVGKELFAQAINTLSNRSGKYIRMNMAGMDDSFVNDSLFGHIRHAFTGAEAHRDGYIKAAEGGCLFLDEIGDLSLSVQIKILRLIEYGEYSPLGSDKVLKADVKIIAATNADIGKKREQGTFRSDLAERLGLRITIPPLRERLDDLPWLTDYFVKKAAIAMNKGELSYPEELIPLLKQYSFPGNVRELESMIEEAVAKSSSNIFSLDVFIQRMNKKPVETFVIDSFDDKKIFTFKSNLDELLNRIMEYFVDKALKMAKQNQTKAAELLGISRDKIKRYVKKKTEDRG